MTPRFHLSRWTLGAQSRKITTFALILAAVILVTTTQLDGALLRRSTDIASHHLSSAGNASIPLDSLESVSPTHTPTSRPQSDLKSDEPDPLQHGEPDLASTRPPLSETPPLTEYNGYRPLPPHMTHLAPDQNSRDYRDWNTRATRELYACMALKNCGPNQEKIVMLAMHWCHLGVVIGFTGGEGVWWVMSFGGSNR